MPSSTASGVRARVRAELVEEIKATARRHLSEEGASGLSLRAVAREVGMVSSAIYRYFPSRDDLLTALIVDAYHSVGAAAEAADATCARADIYGRYLATCHAVRSWASAQPHEYALVYGTPVPGYAAPTDTIDPAARVTLVFIRVLVDGVEAGVIRTDGHIETTRAVRKDLAGLRAAVAPGVPDAVLVAGLLAWTQLFGAISYELFGHLHNVITDYEGFFDLQVRQMAGNLFAPTTRGGTGMAPRPSGFDEGARPA